MIVGAATIALSVPRRRGADQPASYLEIID
jgi:hypothetical protein